MAKRKRFSFPGMCNVGYLMQSLILSRHLTFYLTDICSGEPRICQTGVGGCWWGAPIPEFGSKTASANDLSTDFNHNTFTDKHSNKTDQYETDRQRPRYLDHFLSLIVD